ncbi:hypothetical protein [Solibacillus cecembensis]|uniref:hypothetical protein n=1 Tax=Solibacillus cecembensis TaxID=459347 RepID=UPI003CFDFCE1
MGNAEVNLQKTEKELGYIPQEYTDFNNEDKNINACIEKNKTLDFSDSSVTTYKSSTQAPSCN